MRPIELSRQHVQILHNVMEDALYELDDANKAAGGCDHSVGICMCMCLGRTEALREEIRRLDGILKETICQDCWHDSHDGGICKHREIGDEDPVPCDCNHQEEP